MAQRDQATQFARRVVGRRVVACELVRSACRRHLDDLRTARERGLRWDREAAESAIGFFGHLFHTKGEWDGKPFALEPWQAFIVGSLTGWRQAETGLRRFRVAYVEVPRKNGKTQLAAGVGLLVSFFDGEAGAEGYVAAVKRDQARICWGAAKAMVEKDKRLGKRIKVFVSALTQESTGSRFVPLGADADSTDGLNPHVTIVDEVHAHKTPALIDVLQSASGARRHPLRFEITTAGFQKESVCGRHHDYSLRVLEARDESGLRDDTWFAFIACADDGDDWREPATWRKANPNLGVCLKESYLAAECKRAQEIPAEENVFKRLHLCLWTQQETRWLNMDTWDACGELGPVEPEELVGHPCVGALDLASSNDLAAFALLFGPDDDGVFSVLLRLWCPELRVRARAERESIPYDMWVEHGWIKATSGNIIDQAVIEADILADCERYRVREIAFDRWNASGLVTRLQEKLGLGRLVPFGQGFQSMSWPTKDLGERILPGRKLRHGGNPVLRWMASNVCVAQDPAGNLKPDKARSAEKIDGMVALIMAVGRAQVARDEEEESGMDQRAAAGLDPIRTL